MSVKPVEDVTEGAQIVSKTKVNGQAVVLTYCGGNKIEQYYVVENGVLDTKYSVSIDLGYDHSRVVVRQLMYRSIDELSDL